MTDYFRFIFSYAMSYELLKLKITSFVQLKSIFKSFVLTCKKSTAFSINLK